MRRMFSEKQIKEIANESIQADKRIISQIKLVSGEGIYFPKYVLPLKIKTSSNDIYYFDYNELDIRTEEGALMEDNVSLEDGCVFLDEDVSVIGMEYIMFDGSFSGLNAYDLYNPQFGTKLYGHNVILSNSDEINLITNSATLLTSKEDVMNAWLSSVSAMYYSDEEQENGSILAVSGHGNTIIYYSVANVSFTTVDLTDVSVTGDSVGEL